MSSTINVAVIGAGAIGVDHIASFQQHPSARVVALAFDGRDVRLTDNWFDLHAGESHDVTARLPAGVSVDELRATLTITSLRHSYQTCPPPSTSR